MTPILSIMSHVDEKSGKVWTLMKRRKLFTICLLWSLIQVPVLTNAESLDDLNAKETTVIKESAEISAQVQQTLDVVNQNYRKVDKLRKKITKNEESLEKTHKELADTKERMARQQELVAQRLRSLQVSNHSENQFLQLLNSSNLQEFFNGLYALKTLQSAGQEAVDNLKDEQVKLEALQQKITKTKKNLETSQENLMTETKAYDQQLNTLRQQLEQKSEVLAAIATSKTVELERLAAEKARKEQAEKEQVQTNTQQTPTTDSSGVADKNETTEKPSTQTPTTKPEQNGNGKVLYMESTAYSYQQPGLTPFTAMGIDLRKNPQVIAVDPSVIPLGSVVEVAGYGVALAADTGGAIKGNIIDVHFSDPGQCTVWGRRYNVKVTILS